MPTLHRLVTSRGLVASVAIVLLIAITASAQLRISNIVGAGSAGSPQGGYIELYNAGTSDIPIAPLGTLLMWYDVNGQRWQNVTLGSTGVIPAGRHFLIRFSNGPSVASPDPHDRSTGQINLRMTRGQIALFTTSIGGPTSIDARNHPNLVDLVAWGEDTFGEARPSLRSRVRTSCSLGRAGAKRIRAATSLTSSTRRTTLFPFVGAAGRPTTPTR